MRHRGTVFLIAVLAVSGGLLYGRRLAEVPPRVMHDESMFALQAQSIAASGRDLDGRLLPLYFVEPEFPPGRDPVIIYMTAALLKFVPFNEGNARLATALIGAVNIVLMFLLARAVFGSTAIGLVAAVLLACTPIHFIRARLVLSPFYSIPFILLWLWALVEYERAPSHRRLALAGAWLGLGMYTYLACMVMMPLYLAVTIAMAMRRAGIGASVAAVAGFVAVLAPMLAWYVAHPERIDQIFGSYREFSAVPELTSVAGIKARLALFWSFFDPSFLFITGDSSLVNSTRQAGFFPLAFAVLIPIGLYWIAKSERLIYWIIGGGFLLSPLAAVVSGAVELNRLMFAIPFGVLVACIGAAALMARGGLERLAAILLLASVPLQFARFQDDYYGRYGEQAANWFGGDLRSVFTPIITGEPVGTSTRVYISSQVPFAHRYWRLYALELGRPDMIAAAHYQAAPADAPAGARFICVASSTDCQSVAAGGGWRKESPAGATETPFNIFVREH